MARSHRPGVGPVYVAIESWVDQCLREDGSLFTEAAIWTRANFDELHARFNENPDTSKRGFEEKFRDQLASAPDAAIQLAAECLWVHIAVANDMKPATKRGLVDLVLSWMAEPVSQSAVTWDGLETGLCNSGIAFKTYRPNQLWFLIDFGRAWKELTEDQRSTLLGDPWAFKDWLCALPITSAFAQREALLHFVHPDTFEYIISREHKKQIAKAFASRASGQAHDVDRALIAIRKSLEDERGAPLDFYRDGVDKLWKPEPAGPKPSAGQTPLPVPPPTPEPERRAWVVRLGERPLVDWLDGGYVSLAWSRAGEMRPGIERTEIADRLRQTYAKPNVAMDVAILDRFINGIKPGDLIVVPVGDDLYLGVADEQYWDGPDSPDPRRHLVEWLNADDPLDRRRISNRALNRLNTVHQVADVTELLAELESYLVGPVAGPPSEALALLPVPSALAQELHLPVAWLQELVDLLEEKRQLVLYGPPGTGKTWVAQALADHLTTGGGVSRLVQFHPSYAYEDFFEGFRPRTSAGSSGGIEFELAPGPLRLMADAAKDDPANPYVLIIDELNRANLPKVFGELYFLLEYRDRSVTLQYSREEEFSVPENLFLIGTMNTADRSIALLDAAMRRRFYFVELSPSRAPVDTVLEAWLERRGLSSEPAELLDRLNKAIGDPDFAIGPSYLMHSAINEPGRLERVWERAIMPLLEEHFYGSQRDLRGEFGLSSLRNQDAPPGEDDDDAPTD